MVTDKEIIELVKTREHLRGLVFQRGFLITDAQVRINELFLCREWKEYQIKHFSIWLHPNSEFYSIDREGNCYFLIGHAYNPLTKAYNEEVILNELADSDAKGGSECDQYIRGLTGIFVLGMINEDGLSFQADAAAMRVSYWGIINGKIYVSSHCNLIGMVEKISRDPYVDRLVEYRLYKFFGAGLPGDQSPYLELKRVQCNYKYNYRDTHISFERIEIDPAREKKTYEELIDEISFVLENNLMLISKKWGDRAALSLTGGRDSTMALAGAHNQLQSLHTFSYVSSEGEQLDADAASQIAEGVGVQHQVYPIELSADEEKECGAFSKIIEYNMGCIGWLKEKEIRKRVYFFYHPHFKVEIKSWVDEIGRARPYKRYGIRHFPDAVTPRYLTTMYKVFGANRMLARETDKRFKEYLQTYYQGEILKRVPWVDLLYWEYSWPASEALHLVCEQMLVFDVTIPFNNRLMLEKMLAVPLDKRIADRIQIDVIEKLCPKINELGVVVKDFGWNKKRELLERAYWEVNRRLPI